MKTIFSFARREFKAHFDHPGGYVVLVVFLGLQLFLYFRSSFVVGEASLRPLFGILPWLLLFLVPAVTMRSLAADEKEGTSEVLIAQPVTALQYLIGKYLGALATALVAVLSSAPVLLVLARYGSFDWGLAGAQYLGAVLLVAAMAAIGVFASGLTKNQIVAFILGIAFTFILVVVGWEAALGTISPAFAAFLQELSILWHFENVARGVLDLRDAFYFASIAALFLTFAYAGFLRPRLARFSPAARRVSTWVIAMVALVAVWNGAVRYLPFRADLTSNRLYTLSDATKRILGNLPKDVTLTLYTSQELPAEIELAKRDVTDMVADYRTYGKGRVKVELKHPESDTDKQAAASAGVPPIQFNVMRKGEFQVKEGFFGLTVSAEGASGEGIPYISKTDDFEYQLTRLIRRVTDDGKKTVAFLSGHGEEPEAYGALRQELEKTFAVSAANLATATSVAASPLNNAALLIVAGPKSAPSDAEQALIRDYLAGGGTTLVLADGADVNLGSLSAVPASTGVIAFVRDTFGVTVNPSIVYDLRNNENVQFNTGGPMNFILPYPFWARVGAVGSSPIMKDLKSVVYTWGASLEAAAAAGGVEVSPLLGASQTSGEQRDAFILQPNADFAPKREDLGPRTVAVQVTGLAGGKGRAVVVGSSSMFMDRMLQGKPENLAFALNAVDWLAAQEDLIAIRSKTATPRLLEFASDNERESVRYALMLGLPLLVILIGSVRMWLRRRVTHRTVVTV